MTPPGTSPKWGPKNSIFLTAQARGGVEDTRLEAKAKDTKIIRGQEQPFRGQTLSRPRTGMLEAKAKDQRHKRKCSPKKKKKVFTKFFHAISNKKKKNVFTKMFLAISTKTRFPKNFSSAPQNFNNSKNSSFGKEVDFLYQIIAIYSNHKIWFILGLGLSLLFIYIIYNFTKRTFSALPLALFRNI